MDNLISRKAAIELADNLKDDLPDDERIADAVMAHNEGILDYQTALSLLPSAQPEQRWIPCSERLPENGRQVLVYAISTHFALAKYDEMREADGSYIKQWVTFDAWKPFYRVKNVIAWMELPEPYQNCGAKMEGVINAELD